MHVVLQKKRLISHIEKLKNLVIWIGKRKEQITLILVKHFILALHFLISSLKKKKNRINSKQNGVSIHDTQTKKKKKQPVNNAQQKRYKKQRNIAFMAVLR